MRLPPPKTVAAVVFILGIPCLAANLYRHRWWDAFLIAISMVAVGLVRWHAKKK